MSVYQVRVGVALDDMIVISPTYVGMYVCMYVHIYVYIYIFTCYLVRYKWCAISATYICTYLYSISGV